MTYCGIRKKFSKNSKTRILDFQVSKPKNFRKIPEILKGLKTVETHLGLFTPIFSDFRDFGPQTPISEIPLLVESFPKFKNSEPYPQDQDMKNPIQKEKNFL